MTDTRISLDRRRFLQGALGAGAGVALTSPFTALGARVAGATGASGAAGGSAAAGYGPLVPVRDQTTGLELLRLPRGFEYMSFGWRNDPMSDGTPTPSSHDGMAAFRDGDVVRLVRNHERGTGTPFAAGGRDLRPAGERRHHDAGVRPRPWPAGRGPRQPQRHHPQLRGWPQRRSRRLAHVRGDDRHRRRHPPRLRLRGARHAAHPTPCRSSAWAGSPTRPTPPTPPPGSSTRPRTPAAPPSTATCPTTRPTSPPAGCCRPWPSTAPPTRSAVGHRRERRGVVGGGRLARLGTR